MDTVAKIQVKMSRLKEYILEKVDEGDWYGVANIAMDLRVKQAELNIALELQDKNKDFSDKRLEKLHCDMTNATQKVLDR
jgi:hypothetical protein